jgi:hypothetical protein
MPLVIDAPEIVVQVHDRHAEPPQTRASQRGFWHTLVQYVRRSVAQSPRSTQPLCTVPCQRIETPIERLARQYPSLYLEAFRGV